MALQPASIWFNFPMHSVILSLKLCTNGVSVPLFKANDLMFWRSASLRVHRYSGQPHAAEPIHRLGMGTMDLIFQAHLQSLYEDWWYYTPVRSSGIGRNISLQYIFSPTIHMNTRPTDAYGVFGTQRRWCRSTHKTFMLRKTS